MNDIEKENGPEQADSERVPPEVGYCWQCGYDLRGLGTPRCPECGFRFEIEAVRELNADWCAERILGMRTATLFQGMACAVAVAAALTRGWQPAKLFVVTLGLGPFLMMAWTHLYAHGVSSTDWSRRIVVWAGIGLALFWLIPGSAFVGRLVLIVIGGFLGAREMQRCVEGRNRGRLIGIGPDLLEMLQLSRRINTALLYASAVAFTMVLAFEL